MAAPALDVDKDAIKALALQFGVREAARMSGLAESTVQDWSRHGGWMKDIPRNKPLPVSIRPTRPIGYVPPSDTIGNKVKHHQVGGRLEALELTHRQLRLLNQLPDSEVIKKWVAEVASLTGNLASKAGGWDATTPITATDLRLVADQHTAADTVDQDVMDIHPVADDQSVDLL